MKQQSICFYRVYIPENRERPSNLQIHTTHTHTTHTHHTEREREIIVYILGGDKCYEENKAEDRKE